MGVVGEAKRAPMQLPSAPKGPFQSQEGCHQRLEAWIAEALQTRRAMHSIEVVMLRKRCSRDRCADRSEGPDGESAADEGRPLFFEIPQRSLLLSKVTQTSHSNLRDGRPPLLGSTLGMGRRAPLAPCDFSLDGACLCLETFW